MKKLHTLLASFLITLTLFAQAPEKMSYQAVVRDANNALIMNQAVGMRIQILQGSVFGAAVYVETQTPTSNDNGLVTLEIGTGTIVSGMFGSIDWSTGPYFIKTETDPTGATNYTISGTSQLMSVPYALYAKTADSIAGGITETDPVFNSSIANGITATDTANWNNNFSGDYNDLTNKPNYYAPTEITFPQHQHQRIVYTAGVAVLGSNSDTNYLDTSITIVSNNYTHHFVVSKPRFSHFSFKITRLNPNPNTFNYWTNNSSNGQLFTFGEYINHSQVYCARYDEDYCIDLSLRLLYYGDYLIEYYKNLSLTPYFSKVLTVIE